MRLLKSNRIGTSMTEKYDPYENTIAERINGILIQEFAIDKYDTLTEIKRKLIKNTIEIYNEIYNEIRPHLSNSMLTPNQMYQQSELTRKSYKKIR